MYLQYAAKTGDGVDEGALLFDGQVTGLSVSGMELGLIQPASPSGVATDMGAVRDMRREQPAHHVTKMLPLDHSGQAAFRGFGKADAVGIEAAVRTARSHAPASPAHLALTEPALRPCPRAQPYLYDDSGEELSQFVLALLSDNGTWIADLPVAASQALGKDNVLAAGQGVQVHTSIRKVLRLGTDDAHLSRHSSLGWTWTRRASYPSHASHPTPPIFSVPRVHASHRPPGPLAPPPTSRLRWLPHRAAP